MCVCAVWLSNWNACPTRPICRRRLSFLLCAHIQHQLPIGAAWKMVNSSWRVYQILVPRQKVQIDGRFEDAARANALWPHHRSKISFKQALGELIFQSALLRHWFENFSPQLSMWKQKQFHDIKGVRIEAFPDCFALIEKLRSVWVGVQSVSDPFIAS